METVVQIPDYEIISVIDVGVPSQERYIGDMKMGMVAGKLGFDKHICPYHRGYEFMTGLHSHYLFFKRDQLLSMGLSDVEIDDEEMGFQFYFGHEFDDYFFDALTDNPEEFDVNNLLMIRRAKDEILWLDHRNEGKVYLLKFQIIHI